MSITKANKIILVLAALSRLACSATGSEIVSFNDNGGWCWYQDERVIVQNNKLIIGSVANSAGTGGAARNGNIEVTTYDMVNGGVPQRYLLHPNLSADDHDAPAFLTLPDGRILAMYSKHSGDAIIHSRITALPGDTTSWNADVPLTRTASVCYSNLFRLGSENNGQGRLYDFYRGENFNPNYIISDNNGQSWSYGGLLIRKDGHRPYVKYASNNVDTIHFITTEGHPRDYDNSIYHGTIRGGAIYRSDGTKIQDLSAGPVAPEQLTRVFAGNAANVAWTVDLHLDSQGNPYMAFSVQKDGAGLPSGQGGFDIRYHYGRWAAGQWQVHEMAYAGTKLYSGEDDYSGLVALDPQNPGRVYISTNANPYTGDSLISSADGKRHYELFRGTTADAGASWTWEAITWNSTMDNLRPVVPIWDSPRTVLLWTRGKLTTYTSYNLEVVGMFDPEPYNPDMPLITASPQTVFAQPGQTVTFTVTATSALSVHYAWYKVGGDGVDVAVGADAAQLILQTIQPDDRGYYYCMVSNDAGSVRSATASLVVGELMGHWPLNGDFKDISGNLPDAAPMGDPEFAAGVFGASAVMLDGDDYLNCGTNSALDLAAGGTVCAWVKTANLANAWASIAGKGRYAWRLCRNSSTSYSSFHIDTTAGSFQANGSRMVVDNAWHHVAGAYDGQTLSLYVDGKLDVAVAASGTINIQSLDPVWIGGRSDAGRYWTGAIDEVRIYSYALPAEAIEGLYLNRPCLTVSPYDLNRDCMVDLADLMLFSRTWLDCGLMPRDNCH